MICKKKTVVDQDKKKLGEHIWIWCPGCDEAHTLRVVSHDGKHAWTWNGSLEAPTFSPSLRVTIRYGEKGKPSRVCHSFIKDGKIQFLGDCFHDLKNTTVPLPDLPDWFVED